MKFNKQLQAGAFLPMTLLFFACSDQKVCQNINPLLNKSNYRTPSYRQAVADAIQKLPKESVHYYLEKYFVENGIEFIVANVKSDDILCAKVQLRIKPEVYLENIRKTKGMGYHGSELEDPSFESILVSDSNYLVVSSIKSILD